MTLQELVEEYIAKEEATGLFTPPAQVLQSAIDATRFYCGYASLNDPAAAAAPETGKLDPAVITPAVDVTASEWALIRPLFVLYVEMQSAKVVEASRGMGVEALGRTSSEVASDIKMVEEQMPMQAFQEPCFTIGIPEG